jgi:hypothetical protein
MRAVSTLGEIDAAIDALDDSLRAAGLPGLEEPADVRAVAEVAEAVAPYGLPAELGRFWERVDPASIGDRFFPPLVEPAGALELQKVGDDAGTSVPLQPPPTFLVIGYASHVHRSIELSSPLAAGGTVIRWAWDDAAFEISYRSLSALLATFAELVVEERDAAYILETTEREKQLARLVAAGGHPLYGDLREIPGELESWPIHWLAACGIDLRDREPRGATHTIAELVVAAAEGPVTGRIRGTVMRLVGIGSDVLVVVDDGTRPLDVWCPSGTSPWGPVHGRRFELEVTIDGGASATQSTTAVASDIRPLD